MEGRRQQAVEKDVGDGVLGIGGIDVAENGGLSAGAPTANMADGGVANVDGIEHGGESVTKAMSVECRRGRRGGMKHAAETGQEEPGTQVLRVLRKAEIGSPRL